MPKSVPDPPVLPIDTATRPDFVEPVEPMPAELERRLDKIEKQNLNAEGEQQERAYALPGEDEGPLGEGGQLREPDAGGGGSS
ncbi:MAG: hypothetical protein ACRD2W_07140 [Acidimicrobiales bacterium]